MKWGRVEWMFPTRVRTNNLLVLSLSLFETWKKFATARVSERKTEMFRVGPPHHEGAAICALSIRALT